MRYSSYDMTAEFITISYRSIGMLRYGTENTSPLRMYDNIRTKCFLYNESYYKI